MKILFIHKNFPAQFGPLSEWLSAQGWDVTFATQRKPAPAAPFRIVTWDEVPPQPKGDPFMAEFSAAVAEGRAFAGVAEKLRRGGYVPDVVVAHSGWGVGTFVKDVWPDCRFVPYVEWFYAWPPADVWPRYRKPDAPERRHYARVRNAPILLDLAAADAAIVPTEYQKSRFPASMQAGLTVLPDGVDCDLHAPGARDPAFLARFGIPGDAEVVTYIARGMEPARGFPEMMRLVAALQAERPNLHVVVVGQDRVAYGNRSEKWKDRMLAEREADTSRLHFTGLVSRADLLRVYRASDLHLYLSAPFVLSWSFLEAMASGALILGSDNAPVREFMTGGVNGYLADPEDPAALMGAARAALDDAGARRDGLRAAARETILSRAEAKTIAYPAKKRFFESL